MNSITKILSTALILSAVGATAPAYAQDATSSVATQTPSSKWLLPIASTQNQTPIPSSANLQTLIPSQAGQFTPWTDREPVVLAETSSEKYVRTDLNDFSYPILGGIKYGVQEETAATLTPNSTALSASVVSISPSNNPFDVNSFREGNRSSAQIFFKF